MFAVVINTVAILSVVGLVLAMCDAFGAPAVAAGPYHRTTRQQRAFANRTTVADERRAEPPKPRPVPLPQHFANWAGDRDALEGE